VLRDIDLFKKFRNISVGITITTDDEKIRKTFEPNAPSIRTRIAALKKLHESTIPTYVFVGPTLPMNPEVLAELIHPYADSVLIDRMNYMSKTRNIYKQMKLERWLDPVFIENRIGRLQRGFSGKEVRIC
jgi:DNA repair photolyase